MAEGQFRIEFSATDVVEIQFTHGRLLAFPLPVGSGSVGPFRLDALNETYIRVTEANSQTTINARVELAGGPTLLRFRVVTGSGSSVNLWPGAIGPIQIGAGSDQVFEFIDGTVFP